MSFTTRAISAFNTLVEYATRTGDDFSRDGFGINLLLETQCEELSIIESRLREQIVALRRDKLQIRDIGVVAEWAGVGEDTARRVLAVAAGIDALDVSDEQRQKITGDVWFYSAAKTMDRLVAVDIIAKHAGVASSVVKKVLEEFISIDHATLWRLKAGEEQ
ncbi:hypothetical protein FHS82_003951 [Pseudochelatococcus lubricantis]|uniref:Uncharacterized protein n=1 Tax=Pseudochelatococcus lubricantis TaxID=1538102 RepID=A0ABX0V8J3_9HYPH|nr:hypothetical protein [Pseudochelatococcus lubricantis]NIJ60085.1 hypothetical protein [Pseudochelatococcus lubricantis]